MVETLFVRCVAPAQEWRFNLWSARGLRSSLLVFLGVFSASLFFLAADLQAAPLVRNRTRDQRTLLPAGAREIVRICGIAWTGTGTSAGGLCLQGNRRRGCGFGLIGRRWRCGPERAAAFESPSSSTHPPKRSLDGAPAVSTAWVPAGTGSAGFRCYGRWNAGLQLGLGARHFGADRSSGQYGKHGASGRRLWRSLEIDERR